MKPTKRTQPFKQGEATRQGAGLKAALKGATATGTNPMDARRAAAAQANASTRAQANAATNRAATAAARGKGSLGRALTKKVKVIGGGAGLRAKGAGGRGNRKMPAKPKLAGPGGKSTAVRAGKAGRALKDGLHPRLYQTGKKTNSSGNERDGQTYRTFTVGGKEFHEYKDEKTGKKVVVAGGKKSTDRKLFDIGDRKENKRA